MQKELHIGIIGFDTSHVVRFTQLLNDKTNPFHVPGAKVVAGFPSFSPDIRASAAAVEGYTRQLTENYGLRLESSIEALVDSVDAILLESNDGRRHLREVEPVMKARKPVFIDKPLAASYREAAAIGQLAREYECPFFSSSSLRFDANIAALRRNPELGEVLGCNVFSPATHEKTNPGLFWYGVHGVEILYSFMGTGCRAVRAYTTDDVDITVGFWHDGRMATLRTNRAGGFGYGVTAYGEKQILYTNSSTEVPFYSQLLKQVIPFLAGGPSPVPAEETLEMMAFMEAAWISSLQQCEVTLDEVMQLTDEENMSYDLALTHTG